MGHRNTEETTENGQAQREENSPEILRREFLKRFGSYAAGSAIGLYVLLSSKTSKAAGSDAATP